MSKKPDYIVYNEEEQRYDAFVKPYASNLAAPVIEQPDTVNWKKTNIHSANSQFKATFDEIKEQYQALMQEYQYNQLIYNAKFNFEPIVGHVYHLYSKQETYFLSLLAPEECTFTFVGSFQLNSDKIWKKIDRK